MKSARPLLKLFLLCAALGTALPAGAATLLFSTGADFSVGDIVPVSVVVASPGEAINAVAAGVSYPADKLELLSVSKVSSIVSLWPEEPSYSQAAGTARLEGIIFDPGWQGTAGVVLQYTFRAKAAGQAPLVFSDARVLANDGQATNILTGAPTKTLAIRAAAAKPATTPAPSSSVSAAPVIRSSTHPDPGRWYKSREAAFEWTLSSGVTAVRVQYDKQPATTPTVEYVPAISEKRFTVPSDGVYFFHLQFKTAAGWSTAAHYKFQVDSTLIEEPVEPATTSSAAPIHEEPRAPAKYADIQAYFIPAALFFAGGIVFLVLRYLFATLFNKRALHSVEHLMDEMKTLQRLLERAQKHRKLTKDEETILDNLQVHLKSHRRGA